MSGDNQHTTSRAQNLGRIVLLCGIVSLVYANSFSGKFVFDDYSSILESTEIRRIWPISEHLDNGRPLVRFSFALNYAAGELDPFGYHVVNLAIHLASAVILFGVVRRTLSLPCFAGRYTEATILNLSFACAVLWAVHPLTTQAVTYVVQRFESSASFCYLSCLNFVIRGSTSRRKWMWYAMAVFIAWCGFLCKETMVTAPLVILLYDRMFISESWRHSFRSRGWLYLMLCSPLAWLLPQIMNASSGGSDTGQTVTAGFGYQHVTWWEYAFTQPEIILHYFRLCFWPDPLCFDYAWPVQRNWMKALLTGSMILGLISASIVLALRRHQIGFLGLACFLILAPTSSIMPIADLAVEHRMYLPLSCIVVGVVFSVFHFVERLLKGFSGRFVSVTTVSCSLFVLAMAVLGWQTHDRNRDYQSDLYLWSSVLKLRPQNGKAWYGLGKAYWDRDNYEKAFEVFDLADREGFGTPRIDVGLADCYAQFGQHELSIEFYRKAIAKAPAFSVAHHNLGVALYGRGELEQALIHFKKAAADLKTVESQYNTGSMLFELGRDQEARAALEVALKRRPDYVRAAMRLAWVLSVSPEDEVRDGPRALKLLTTVCDPEISKDPRLLDTLAAAYAECGHYSLALKNAEHARRLAQDTGLDELARKIDRRCDNYRSRKPYREPIGRRHHNAGGLSRQKVGFDEVQGAGYVKLDPKSSAGHLAP